MTRRRAVVLGLLAAAALGGAAAAADAPLAAGAAFPALVGASPSGARIALPAAANGAPFVVIFANTEKGGEIVPRWSHALFAALPSGIRLYAVADLSGVPRLFRGFALKGIAKQASPTQPQHRDQIVVLTDKNPIGARVPAGRADDAVIIAVDRAGAVTLIERRAWSDAEAAAVTKRITDALGPAAAAAAQ